jgi:hypothetical protein
MQHVWGRGDVHTGIWYRDLRKEDHLGDPGVEGRIISKWIFKKWDGEAGTGLSWLSIRTDDGFL